MKPYPTIPGEIIHEPIYAFDKLDGSNIRAEWSRKRGFYKFGKRNHLLDDTNPVLRESQQLIVDGFTESMTKTFREQRWERAVCFFEFYGPRSFAGNHEDETHEVTLIDVAGPRGILEPRDFLDLFGNLKTAKLLHHGNPSSDFLDQVRSGTLNEMTFEGVVCKGKWVSPGRPLMFKVKNQAWYAKLRATYAGDEKRIEQLM
jgi:hypothetical protein